MASPGIIIGVDAFEYSVKQATIALTEEALIIRCDERLFELVFRPGAATLKCYCTGCLPPI
jgi:hypothetical protein